MLQLSSRLLLSVPIVLPVQVCGLLFTHSSLCHSAYVFVVTGVRGEDIAQLLTITERQASSCEQMGRWCYKNDSDA